jgi:nitroimidazol reductase NimA-like FMN-containing flavoprotein (pyridoxamine 5'-phosphate oxidase superfamily)
VLSDEGLVAQIGLTGDDGQPFVMPMAYARQGDRLLLHGSVLSRLTQRAADGVPVCVTVTLLDGFLERRSPRGPAAFAERRSSPPPSSRYASPIP